MRPATIQSLSVGESATRLIAAQNLWNDTGIRILVDQEYHFTTTGQWIDWYVACDADGFVSPSPALWPFEWLRRVPYAPWFALIGAIDRDQRTQFLIGTNRKIIAPASGELTCFANDTAFAYWNNIGSVEVTITRTR